MIIIDGPDGSGKSHLIEQLGYEWRSFKALYGGTGSNARGNWGDDDEAPTAYARQILGADLIEQRTGQRIAFDRFHLSELVYGPILRGWSGITPDEVRILQRLLNAKGIPTVICLPPYERTRANVEQEGRERPSYQTPQFLEQAYIRWVDTVRTSGSIKYDYTVSAQPPILTSFRPTCPPGVIGDPKADVLFVGGLANHPLDLPFFSMEGSSGYLNKSLKDAGFREDEMAFVCAGGREVTGLGSALNMPCLRAVVSLGERAAQTLYTTKDLHVSHYAMPHPQAWRATHPNQRGQYVDQLAAIRKRVG